ncbi:hypothetical protein PROFUN_05166 [Planoprotostelium fungivorum]|uniref:Late endosomal/lysosomal adaptor and MAPK and MTOR activator 1 n=1 Tax=Planoprotostelium fungivorum TaxID=1890364 RepID=A0A2P6NRV9_9EUKA|nr:hypothetical protein PROFUN_05166 [Planoprotostelium fungivorum]
MGCNQSKTQDVSRARQDGTRTRQNGGSRSGSLSQGPTSRPVGIGHELVKDIKSSGVAMSYTDTREGEFDYLKKIIDQTASNLIDVSSTFSPYDQEANASNRDYREHANTYIVKQGLLNGLPRSSASNTAETLSGAPPKDLDWLTGIVTTCSTAAKNGMKVTSTGPIIIHFPEVN